MKNSRGFIQIIIILIALVLVTAGSYYFGTKNKLVPSPVAFTQPSPSPVATADSTANWKTYNNTVIGITFKYPAAWTYKENETKQSVDFSTRILSQEMRENSRIEYLFNVQIDPPDNFSQWSNYPGTVSLGKENINGIEFEKYKVADMLYSIVYVYKSSNQKIYRASVWPYDEKNYSDTLNDTIIKVLSTFKSTN